jgi:hypothetical protein
VASSYLFDFKSERARSMMSLEAAGTTGSRTSIAPLSGLLTFSEAHMLLRFEVEMFPLDQRSQLIFKFSEFNDYSGASRCLGLHSERRQWPST